MRRKHLKSLFVVGSLVAVTCIAMRYSGLDSTVNGGVTPIINGKSGVVTLSGNLTQDKILYGADGNVALALTLSADEVFNSNEEDAGHVDMVIVLDRSGSMEREKLGYARQAVLDLLGGLTSKDRFAIVTYSDGVRRESALLPVTADNRERMKSIINKIRPGGGTNLGAGLQEGMNVLLAARKNGNIGKVILISDGLANQGITDPASLGNMASIAAEKEFGVSTVGVGADFNEQLMTTLADRGTGNYYYLENPDTFASVFEKEFQNARSVAASSVEIRIPLARGVSIVDAAGYPIDIKDSQAVFHPGDLLSGQARKLFVTLRVPTNKEGTFEVSGITARYLHKGKHYTVTLPEPFQIACVKEKKEVFASIKKEEWEEKVLDDELNRLKGEVALDIKNGAEEEAMKKIDNYYNEQQAVNSEVQSGKVAESLDKDLGDLRKKVRETFTGSSSEVRQKQKYNSKAMQFEGYVGRRNSK